MRHTNFPTRYLQYSFDSKYFFSMPHTNFPTRYLLHSFPVVYIFAHCTVTFPLFLPVLVVRTFSKCSLSIFAGRAMLSHLFWGGASTASSSPYNRRQLLSNPTHPPTLLQKEAFFLSRSNKAQASEARGRGGLSMCVLPSWEGGGATANPQQSILFCTFPHSLLSFALPSR